MSHSDHSRPRPKRQMLAEQYKGKSGQKRAQRADQGRNEAIRESIESAADSALDFYLWESDFGPTD